eukprot:CAMPEP_0195297780 /NCGR_PEP_ID=MMETSP0707-20130614/22146_1 /TAXON_ID=33640 /ORGANISM="Asterionellopsis glacialis, Strain CCMP134" /LENGTH=318 /DNA_ID=CAMNT_0040359683 /DNA_START=128 /DNA_END=1084 /DNA_ORIENTATION=+
MAAFPFTAPRVTEEERLQEIASLPQEERDLMEMELRGTDLVRDTNNGGKIEVDLGSYKLHMQEELERIPVEDKLDYEEALIRAPELVEIESNSVKFLRKHRLDCKKAAQNLISYWALRVRLFGHNRAFLPMEINGALQDDFEALETGFFQILGEDSHGRSIVYHEKTRADPTIHHRDSLCRVAFYILHVASHVGNQDRRRLSDGFVIINNPRGIQRKDINRLYAKTIFKVLEETPLKLKAAHVPTSTMKWRLPSWLFVPIYMAVAPKVFRNRTYWYIVATQLEEFGIFEDQIPLSAGGTYTDASFAAWLESQRELEQR